MAKPARLRYIDSNGDTQIIGTYRADDGLIDTFTLINGGEPGEVTQCIIEGSSDLLGKFPTSASETNSSEPEIFVDYQNSNGNWVQRDRVFAAKQGFVKNDGSYKNKRLYGFQRYYQATKVKVSSGTVTTNIVDALQTVLNDSNIDGNYTVVSPTDSELSNDASTSISSRPSVDDYTIDGPARKAFRDLCRNYRYLLWFTSETDNSGNYKVYFEPVGYGSTIETFDRDAGDTLYVVNWTKDDDREYVTEVEVFGTDGSGNEYSATSTASPNDGKLLKRNINYLQSNSEAQSIADRLLDDSKTEQGKVDVTLRDNHAINGSYGVVDGRFDINGTFTAVWQKDSFHDGKTTLSFEYEGILRERDRDTRKFQDERNNELRSITQKEAGKQDLSNGNVGKGGASNLVEQTDTDLAAGDYFADQTETLDTFSVNSSPAIEALMVMVSITSKPTASVTGQKVLQHNFELKDSNGTEYPGGIEPTVETRHRGVHDINGNDIWQTDSNSWFYYHPEDLSGLDIELRYEPFNGDPNSGFNITWITIEKHDDHPISGETASKLLDLLSEDRKDR